MRSESRDTAAALAGLDAIVDDLASDGTPAVAIGFSMGGAWARWLPAERPSVAASVVHDGSMTGPSLARRVPVFGNFAETDACDLGAGGATRRAKLEAARPAPSTPPCDR